MVQAGYKLQVTSYKLKVTSYKLKRAIEMVQAGPMRRLRFQPIIRSLSAHSPLIIRSFAVNWPSPSYGAGGADAAAALPAGGGCVRAGELQVTSYKLQVTSYNSRGRFCLRRRALCRCKNRLPLFIGMGMGRARARGDS